MPRSYPVLLFFSVVLMLRCHGTSSTLLWCYCPPDANYTTNSTFQTNLHLLLASLSSSAAATGYSNDTEGRSSDQVHGLALCRGDVSSSVCQTCLDAAVQDIIQSCPNGMTSTIFYVDCLLRYSNQMFFSTADTSFRYWAWNTQNVSNQQQFETTLGNLMNDLTEKASSSPKLFAAGSAKVTSFDRLYGLVQCTRDLSAYDCYECLQYTLTFIPKCCSWRKGGKVYLQSCYLRFESDLFYNLSAVEAPPPRAANDDSGGKSNNAVKTVLLVVVPVAAALLSLLAIFMYCRRRKPAMPRRMQLHKRMFDNEDQQEIKSAESLLLDLEVIRSATNNFSDANKLGEGGFGPVYRGTLDDGEQIAVKRLSRTSGQGIVELKNEVVLLAKLQHRNLVRLLGCCLQEEEKLLVYEYLPNASLDKVLFDPVRRVQLDWARRYKIIEGIGRGLLYLHEDSRLKIVHRDLKASNILLGWDMNPKISDFGLAKLFDVDETRRNTSRIAGTYGYMAPEYALRGRFSTNSDVYSYGVLILEILTGRKNCGYQGSGNSIDLLGYVWRHWNQGDAMQVVDQSVVDRCQPQEVLRCMHIGLLCVQEDPAQRPSMASITLMLNSYSIGLPPLSAPAFVTRSITVSGSGVHGRDTQVSLQGREIYKGSTTRSAKESKNDTLLEGSLQLSGSSRLAVPRGNRVAAARPGLAVRAQQQAATEGDSSAHSSRRAVLGIVATGLAGGSFVKAVLADAKSIKVGPPPPPSGGLRKFSAHSSHRDRIGTPVGTVPLEYLLWNWSRIKIACRIYLLLPIAGTLNADQPRDLQLPLKQRFYPQPLPPSEAAARAKESAKDILNVKQLIDKKEWPYVMNDLRLRAGYLRFDLSTIISAKPKEEKKKELTGKLFAAIDEVSASACMIKQSCHFTISSPIQSVLTSICRQLDRAAKIKSTPQAEKHYATTKSLLDDIKAGGKVHLKYCFDSLRDRKCYPIIDVGKK
ncbi:receptor-like protein kinase [Musa troglodytarum]|uniref:Receptor-like protein kinase n=1 Tax=Musa troglodytarum TaxID=320322 RepID=A0A9E7HES5_9LILI|nr:receptor-like protein kinase [Musa troglodytarum]